MGGRGGSLSVSDEVHRDLKPVSPQMIFEMRDSVLAQPEGSARLEADRGELLCVLELAIHQLASIAIGSRDEGE